MSKSTFEYFTGELAWAHRLFIPDEKYGKYSVNVKLSPEERKRLKDCGSKKRPNEAGYINFSRDVEKNFGKGTVTLDPPVVLQSDGSPWGDERIGNGSTGTVKVEIYNTTYQGKPIKGTRLISVRVDDLVEYIAPSETTESTPEPSEPTVGAMPF